MIDAVLTDDLLDLFSVGNEFFWPQYGTLWNTAAYRMWPRFVLPNMKGLGAVVKVGFEPIQSMFLDTETTVEYIQQGVMINCIKC